MGCEKYGNPERVLFYFQLLIEPRDLKDLHYMGSRVNDLKVVESDVLCDLDAYAEESRSDVINLFKVKNNGHFYA